MEKQSRLQWIYSASSMQELAVRYDEWAENYDKELEQEFGWRGPKRAAEFLSQYVPRQARILDAGVGTGLVAISCLPSAPTSIGSVASRKSTTS